MAAVVDAAGNESFDGWLALVLVAEEVVAVVVAAAAVDFGVGKARVV